MTDVESLLSRRGIFYKLRGREAIATCPFCLGGKHREKDSFQVNTETGAWTCNRKNNCGLSGSFRQLQEQLGEQPIGLPKLMESPKRLIYTKPDKAKLQGGTDAHLEWFQNRGIERETVEAYGVTTQKGAMALPVYSPLGELVNIKWRALGEKKFWNEKDSLRLPFGIQNVPEDSESLLIVEGEIDALTAHQYGIKSVISLPNGTGDQDWIEPLWDWLDRFKAIWIATDMDEAGQGVRKLLVERLGRWRCRGVNLPHKDLNDCLKAGVTAEEIIAILQGAEEFTPDKLRSASDFTDQVISAFLNTAALYGKPTGFVQLDALIKGWRGGELSVWTGQNGSGKSTVLGQVALNLVEGGERVVVASLELAPARYLRWLVCQQANESEPDEDTIREAMDAIGQGAWFVDHVGSIKTPILLDTFEYAARRYGTKHFVVDSLVKLGISGDDYNGQRQAVSDLCDFADRFDCHIHLVAHPRKADSDSSAPGKVDVKGAGEITDLADNVFAVVRNPKPKPDEATTILTILKNREHGVLGAVPLMVNPDSKRVYEGGLAYGREESVRVKARRYTPAEGD